jgi:hypothetical protein
MRDLLEGQIEINPLTLKDVLDQNGDLGRVGGYPGLVELLGAEGAGINGAIMPKQKPDHAMTNYVNVTNIDATIEKATKAGAKVALAKMPIPGVGAVACPKSPVGVPCSDRPVLGS